MFGVARWDLKIRGNKMSDDFQKPPYIINWKEEMPVSYTTTKRGFQEVKSPTKRSNVEGSNQNEHFPG